MAEPILVEKNLDGLREGTRRHATLAGTGSGHALPAVRFGWRRTLGGPADSKNHVLKKTFNSK